MSLATLDQHIEQGTMIRHKWTDIDAQGRKLAGLLTALSPEAGEHANPAYCPSSIMPQWLAFLTPWINDAGTEEAWSATIRRYRNAAHRWHAMRPDDWSRLERRFKAIALREARRHVNPEFVTALAAIDRVLNLLDRDDATRAEYKAAAVAAAPEAAVVAALAGAWTAVAAAVAAVVAALAGAWTAVAAAVAAVWAAAAVAAEGAAEEAKAAAAQRIIDAFFTEFESMLDWVEARNAADLAT